MTPLLWESIKLVIDKLPDNQQKIIRFLYEQRLTRPYVAATCGISSYQVMIEEVSALRVVIEQLAVRCRSSSPAVPKKAARQTMKPKPKKKPPRNPGVVR